jgi:hypothetical protein
MRAKKYSKDICYRHHSLDPLKHFSATSAKPKNEDHFHISYHHIIYLTNDNIHL